MELLYVVRQGALLCLTETQKKIDEIKRGSEVEVIQSMREMQDRKGGGLLCACRKEDMKIDQQKTRSRYLLHATVEIPIIDLEFELVVTYWRTGNEAEVGNYNGEISKEIGEIVRKTRMEEKNLIVMGDFNGHLGYVGYQEENRNGRIVNDLIWRSDLILVNIDEMCRGTYAWERGEQKSAIDLIMTNNKIYNLIESMIIDEERNQIDISDHCIIELRIKGHKQKRKVDTKQRIEKKHFKFSEERIKKYKDQVERNLNQEEGKEISKINNIIIQAAKDNLAVRYRKRCREGMEKRSHG